MRLVTAATPVWIPPLLFFFLSRSQSESPPPAADPLLLKQRAAAGQRAEAAAFCMRRFISFRRSLTADLLQERRLLHIHIHVWNTHIARLSGRLRHCWFLFWRMIFISRFCLSLRIWVNALYLSFPAFRRTQQRQWQNLFLSADFLQSEL